MLYRCITGSHNTLLYFNTLGNVSIFSYSLLTSTNTQEKWGEKKSTSIGASQSHNEFKNQLNASTVGKAGIVMFCKLKYTNAFICNIIRFCTMSIASEWQERKTYHNGRSCLANNFVLRLGKDKNRNNNSDGDLAVTTNVKENSKEKRRGGGSQTLNFSSNWSGFPLTNAHKAATPWFAKSYSTRCRDYIKIASKKSNN